MTSFDYPCSLTGSEDMGPCQVIEKILIKGYRKFRDVTIQPNSGYNILVGENEAGKSTLIEALGLALTGRINGRHASDELNPYWFNQQDVAAFFDARLAGLPIAPPRIEIEIFLDDRAEFQRSLYGAHNSASPTTECAGIHFRVIPNPDYRDEMEQYLASEPSILPVEHYKIDWRSFGDFPISGRPKEITTAIIDSRTIRSRSGVDFHLRQMLSDHLEPEEKAAVSVAFRSVKERMTNEHLKEVNDRMRGLEGALDEQSLSLAMDQSTRSSWDSSVVPHIADVPFDMAGLGQQASVKIALAMGHTANKAHVVTIEEPENHLSHTSLSTLLYRIERLMGEGQQLFITTHSSFVLNRLGLDQLMFITNGRAMSMAAISPATVAYYKKLPGYDTLRMVLASKIVLVEGPSDEILFEYFYTKAQGRRPIEDGIDVISMRALSQKRSLELVKALGKRCAVLLDNDGKDPAAIAKDLEEFLESGVQELFIGVTGDGKTLEPQILSANRDEQVMRRVLNVTDCADLLTWMTNNKTEAALRIAESDHVVHPPKYFTDAIEFISDLLR